MTENNIILTLNTQDSIILKLEGPLDTLECCNRSLIVFVSGDQSFAISDGPIKHVLDEFIVKLMRAVKGDLLLHSSINEDIGYLANEDIYGKTVLCYEKVCGIDSWVGWDYNVFGIGGRNRINTWLYNDKKGGIFIELTPGYPWVLGDKKRDPEYLPYSKWIKNYQPILARKVPKNIAKKWLQEALYLVQKINERLDR